MTTTLTTTTSRGASLLLRRFSNATTTTTTYKDFASFFFSSSSPQKRFHPPRHHYTHYYGTQTKGGSYFSQGTQTGRNGVLFGETPPKEGQKRVRESWEAPYFITAALTAGILYFGLNAKPNSSLVDWAKEEAKKRLDDDER